MRACAVAAPAARHRGRSCAVGGRRGDELKRAYSVPAASGDLFAKVADEKVAEVLFLKEAGGRL